MIVSVKELEATLNDKIAAVYLYDVAIKPDFFGFYTFVDGCKYKIVCAKNTYLLVNKNITKWRFNYA